MKQLCISVAACLLLAAPALAQLGSGLMFPGPGLTSVAPAGCGSCVFTQGEQASSASSVTSITKAFDSNNTSGNLLFAACGAFGNNFLLDNSDTVGNSYSSSISRANPASLMTMTVSYAVAGSSAANSVKCQPTASTFFPDLVLTEFGGFTGTPALDQTSSSSCTSCGATITTPSITITQTEMVISAIYDVHTAHTWSVPAGWTICAKCATSNAEGETAAVAYQLLTAGTYSLTWTNNGAVSNNTAYTISSFK